MTLLTPNQRFSSQTVDTIIGDVDAHVDGRADGRAHGDIAYAFRETN